MRKSHTTLCSTKPPPFCLGYTSIPITWLMGTKGNSSHSESPKYCSSKSSGMGDRKIYNCASDFLRVCQTEIWHGSGYMDNRTESSQLASHRFIWLPCKKHKQKNPIQSNPIMQSSMAKAFVCIRQEKRYFRSIGSPPCILSHDTHIYCLPLAHRRAKEEIGKRVTSVSRLGYTLLLVVRSDNIFIPSAISAVPPLRLAILG